MAKPRIFVTQPIAESAMKRLRALGSVKVYPDDSRIIPQTTLIEAAKMAPRYSPELAMLHDKERKKGNANRATLAVARKLVAYLMAVDRGQRNFQVQQTAHQPAA